MNKDNPQNLYEVTELFRKSFSGTLAPEEQLSLDKILADDSLLMVYEQLGDEEYVISKLRELEKYPYYPAYEKLRKLHRRRITRRRRIAMVSAAAVIFAAALGGRYLLHGNEQTTVPMIESGRSLATLTLTDGSTVFIDDQAVAIDEPEGGRIVSENGELVYTAEQTDFSAGYNRISIPVGGEYKIRLGDKTTIWLNADSRLRYPVAFTGSERRVFLEGEAYFEVTPDCRPFIVETKSGKVKVLGTSFGIFAYPGETELTTLVNGSVSVISNSGQQVTLTPGEQAMTTLTGELTKCKVNIDEYVGWKNGNFIFRDKPLSDIMDVLGRWYGITALFNDPSLESIQYSGNLKRYESISAFLELLQRLNNIHYKIDGGTIILYR